MEPPFLHTGAYSVIMINHFDYDFSTASKKILRYSAELERQMDNRSIALYDFLGMFFHGVVKLLFSNKFLSDQWLP